MILSILLDRVGRIPDVPEICVAPPPPPPPGYLKPSQVASPFPPPL